MREYVKVRFEAEVRIQYSGEMCIPKDVWEKDHDPAYNWGKAADKFIRENLTLYPGDVARSPGSSASKETTSSHC